MDPQIAKSLESIVGKSYIETDRSQMENYLFDETAESVRPQPASDLILVKPVSSKEISKILGFANKNKIPVFPRGGGTGLVGGAIPVDVGIILSMERMNNIRIDQENLMVIAEAGVTLERILRIADDAGLFFPLHPGDESAHVGGLVACNAGGARAIKYGVMRNYVKGMEIVLPTGEILRLGGKLQKSNVGYDLMHLIMGSEGTLAVITEAIIRLFPKFGPAATLIVPFDSCYDGVNSVPKILQSGIMPLAIEYVEKDLMEKTAKHIGETWPVKDGKCCLLILITEANRDLILSQSLKITEICKDNGALEPLFAESQDEQDKILRIRSNIYSALKRETADILDITVPPAEIGKVIEVVENTTKEYNVNLPVYGHVADGNLHVHIMNENADNVDYIEKIIDEIYGAAIKLGGVITGEHGIGKIRTDKLHLNLKEKELELMKGIKRMFDPNNILNPQCNIEI